MQNLDRFKYSVTNGATGKILTIPAYKSIEKYFYGDCCLELGSGDGAGTKILLDHFKEVTAVDGSKIMLDKLKRKLKSDKLTIIHSYFEQLKPIRKYDTIVMSHILEHVDNPVKVLNIAKDLAHQKTKIIIVVPNANSLHRQAGVLMGMIKNIYSFNERDKIVGHQRIYDIKKLKTDISKANLRIIKTGGFFIKCFSTSQIKNIIKNPIQIDAFYKLGEKYSEISAELYAICKI